MAFSFCYFARYMKFSAKKFGGFSNELSLKNMLLKERRYLIKALVIGLNGRDLSKQ
jgi:hypothetical protein